MNTAQFEFFLMYEHLLAILMNNHNILNKYTIYKVTLNIRLLWFIVGVY